jgi:pimeloyl-ACP methyl ester carboxylesterase
MLTRTTVSRFQHSALRDFQRGFAICALVLTGCASTPPQLLDAQRVNVAGTQIAYAKSGSGTPVVVFENGLAAQKEVWAEVASDIAKTHTVFMYDRPGQGASSSSNQPRSGSQIVEDLRSLLKSQHLQPPYVLVGHSLGALYMQLYARKYPQEVCGLVLVDSTHPLHFAGDGAQEKRSFLSRTVMAVGLWGNASQEFKNIAATGQEVLALPPLRSEIAAVILIAPQNIALADPSDAALNQRDNDLRWDFAKLYASAQVRETHTGHNVHSENPKLVAQAIEEVLAKAVKLAQ